MSSFVDEVKRFKLECMLLSELKFAYITFTGTSILFHVLSLLAEPMARGSHPCAFLTTAQNLQPFAKMIGKQLIF